MNGLKPTLRLIVITQTFLLFALVLLPALIRYMHEPLGKSAYGVLAVISTGLAILLRRAFTDLDR